MIVAYYAKCKWCKQNIDSVDKIVVHKDMVFCSVYCIDDRLRDFSSSKLRIISENLVDLFRNNSFQWQSVPQGYAITLIKDLESALERKT